MNHLSTGRLYELLRLHASGDPENELDQERIDEIRKEIADIEFAEQERPKRERDEN